jgi:hypothetical protein
MWLLPTINLLAPIFKHMWAMWENVSKEEVVLPEDGRARKTIDQDY